jgi:hypothetical protein
VYLSSFALGMARPRGSLKPKKCQKVSKSYKTLRKNTISYQKEKEKYQDAGPVLKNKANLHRRERRERRGGMFAKLMK